MGARSISCSRPVRAKLPQRESMAGVKMSRGRVKTTLSTIIGRHTKKSADEVMEDSDRDFFMSSQEARDYGLIDEIVDTTKAMAT